MEMSFLLRDKNTGEFFCSINHYGFDKVSTIPVLFGATEFEKDEAFMFLSENKEYLSDFEVVCRCFDVSVFSVDDGKQDHLLRVEAERNILNEKIEALERFVKNKTVENIDYEILEDQLLLMISYRNTLDIRIS